MRSCSSGSGRLRDAVIGAAMVLAIGCRLLAGEPERAEAASAGDLRGADSLASLRPILRHFDFEEPDAAPNSLPVPFYRYLDPSQGFPPFGAMRHTNDAAHEGNGSLEFELGGGSMSARIPTSVIPILPLADYAVTVHVRAQSLKHARARLVAWMHDQAGNLIHESRVQSSLASGANWEQLRIEIRGKYPEAADLVIELQVLQPEQFNPIDADPNEPHMQDITGRVWFDDLKVANLPHVSLRMSQPGNVIRLPDTPQFEVQVSELASRPLTARLQVFDIDGQTALDQSFPAPRDLNPGIFRAPLDRCGWYRAVLTIHSPSGSAHRKWLDFVVLPERNRNTVSTDRFGVVLSKSSAAHVNTTSRLIESLRVGAAVVPIWDTAANGSNSADDSNSLHGLIDQLLHRDVQLVFALDTVPTDAAGTAGIESSQARHGPADPLQISQAQFDDLLMNFGLEVNRWQLGFPSRSGWNVPEYSPDSLQRVHSALRSYVPEPLLHLAWPLEQELTIGELHGASSLIPILIQPHAIEQYAANFLNQPDAWIISLEQLPDGQFSARQRVSDLSVRSLYAWRAGIPIICIAEPWILDSGEPSHMPSPAYGVWRTLADQLNGRRFISELPLAEGMYCWVLEGKHRDDAALVAWTHRLGPEHTSVLRAQLAAGPVMAIDAFGNRMASEPVDGIHAIALHDTPTFIEDVNLSLVQFRSSVKVDPAFVPAVAKAHERSLVLRNPWDVPVSGSIRIAEHPEWTISPASQEFAIKPGGEVRLPMTIVPQRSILAGSKKVSVEITLNADQPYRMSIAPQVEVGIQNIDLTATCIVARNPATGQSDLVITQAVTNHGDQSVNLDVDVLAEGIGQNRRVIAGLQPGQTAVRTFRIPNGSEVLAGQQVRVSVAERDGLTRLNKLLAIPPASDHAMAQAEDR